MKLVQAINQLEFNTEIFKRLPDFQVNNFNTLIFSSFYPNSITIFVNDICIPVEFKTNMIQLLNQCRFTYFCKNARYSMAHEFCTVNVIGETDSSIQHKILLYIIKDYLDV